MPQRRDGAIVDTSLVIALLPVVALPFALGGVHPIVATIAALASLFALAVYIAARRGAGYVRVSWFGAPILLGLAFTALELLPVPRAVRTTLSPVGSSNVDFMVAGLPPALRATVLPVLSLDPPETAFALVRLIGALAVFVVVAGAVRDRRVRSVAWRVLGGGAGLLVLVALGHTLLHVNGAWGKFTHYPGIIYAPMVNPNQLAAIFGALGLALVGRALVIRDRREAVVLGSIGVASCICVLLTSSRGGALALVVGAAGALFIFLRRRPRESGARRWLIASGLIGTLVVCAWLLFVMRSPIITILQQFGAEPLTMSKLSVYGPALELLRTHSLVGVGNGAFGSTFTTVAGAALPGRNVYFTRVENVVLETLIDHGIIAGGMCLAAGLLLAIAALAVLRRPTELVSLPSLVFLVVGDFFDFALDDAAGLYLAATLLGLLAARMLERGATGARLPWRAALACWLGLAALCAAVAPMAVSEWHHRFDVELQKVRGPSQVALVERAIAAHPHDGHYAWVRAVAARHARQPAEALRWANRALVVWPSHSGAHVEAARVLAFMGKLDQAMLEYREAWRGEPRPPGLLAEITARTRDVQMRRRGVPDEARAIGALCAVLVREGRLQEAQTCMDEVARRADADDDARRAPLELAIRRNDPAAMRACLADLSKRRRLDGATAVEVARARETLDGLAAARIEADALDGRVDDPSPLLEWRARAAIRANDLAVAERLSAALRALPIEHRAPAAADNLDADIAHAQGNSALELAALERVLEATPQDVKARIRVGNLALALGQTQRARRAATAALRLSPHDPAARRLAERASVPGSVKK